MDFTSIILAGGSIIGVIFAVEVLWTVFFENYADTSQLTFHEKHLLVVSIETQGWVGLQLGGGILLAIIYTALFNFFEMFGGQHTTVSTYKHFVTGAMVALIAIYPFYRQVIDALALIKKQNKYGLLYCWLNPHALEFQIIQTYSVTIGLFRLFLVPTAIFALVAVILFSYALFDTIQQWPCKRDIHIRTAMAKDDQTKVRSRKNFRLRRRHQLKSD